MGGNVFEALGVRALSSGVVLDLPVLEIAVDEHVAERTDQRKGERDRREHAGAKAKSRVVLSCTQTRVREASRVQRAAQPRPEPRCGGHRQVVHIEHLSYIGTNLLPMNVLMSGASWLCPTELDRSRVVDANDRVRTIRRVGSLAVGIALVISAPWVGWWTLILFAASALNFAVVDRLLVGLSSNSVLPR